jgi:hypothetical protein
MVFLILSLFVPDNFNPCISLDTADDFVHAVPCDNYCKLNLLIPWIKKWDNTSHLLKAEE